MALITDLVSYWKLDETSAGDAIDAHGSSNGTNNGPTINQTGKIEKAYLFDGSNDYLDCGNHASLNFTDVVSISCWVKTGGQGASDRCIISKGTHWVGYYLIAAGDGSDKIYSVVNGIWTCKSTTAFNDNAWHHVVLVYDGSYIYIYVDGTEEDKEAKSGAFTPSGSNLIMGRRTDGLYSREWAGTLDEVGLWNKALTQAEVTSLYNSGNGFAYPFSAAGTNFKINIGDSWKTVSEMKINIGDSWKAVNSAKINIGDSWKTIF